MKVLVYVSNLRLLGCFILVYFGGGSCSCSCCCSCDRGKTKSTPSPRLWTLDWSLTIPISGPNSTGPVPGLCDQSQF